MGGHNSRCIFPWKRNRKITPISLENNLTGAEILTELKRTGFLTTLEKPGGIRIINITENGNDHTKKTVPRRLPAINRDKKPLVKGNSFYNNEEKRIMAEIRRMDILKERGKMARQSTDRRKKAIEKKQRRLEDKINKTNEKLQKCKKQTMKSPRISPTGQGDTRKDNSVKNSD